MKVKDLAQRCGQLIARGAGDFDVTVFQWGYQAELLDEVIERPGTDTVELYSRPLPEQEPILEDSHASREQPAGNEWDDLI